MDAVTYPSEAVKETIAKYAVPVRLDMWKERDLSRKLKALWTPNFLYLDADGTEWHRDLGYLPPDDWQARFLIGSALLFMQTRQLDKCESCLDEVLERFGETHYAPEARYFKGVVGMRKSKVVKPIYEACKDVLARWPDSIWAKKLAFTSKYDNFDTVGKE